MTNTISPFNGSLKGKLKSLAAFVGLSTILGLSFNADYRKDLSLPFKDLARSAQKQLPKPAVDKEKLEKFKKAADEKFDIGVKLNDGTPAEQRINAQAKSNVESLNNPGYIDFGVKGLIAASAMLIGAFSLSKKRRGPSGLLYGVRRIEERKYNDTVREAAYESTGISGFDRWGLDNLGFIPREFGKKNKPLTKAFSDAVQKEVPEHAFPLYFKSRVKAVDAPGDVTGYQDQDLGGGILKPIYGTKAAFEPIEGATRAEVQLAKKTNTSGPK